MPGRVERGGGQTGHLLLGLATDLTDCLNPHQDVASVARGLAGGRAMT